MTNFDEDTECTSWIILIVSFIALTVALCAKIYF